jgi:hypothetical protein
VKKEKEKEEKIINGDEWGLFLTALPLLCSPLQRYTVSPPPPPTAFTKGDLGDLER